MSKTTNFLLVVTLFAAVAVHSAYSADAADALTLTNSSFYKEKGYGKLVATGDASLATGASRDLIAGKNSKTNYYVYQTNTPVNKDDDSKGGTTTLVFRKVDVNKLALTADAAATVTLTKWGGTNAHAGFGASVKNNVTVIASLWVDPAAVNLLKNIYVYLFDLDKNEKTEILVASASWTDVNTYTDVSPFGGWTSGTTTFILYQVTSVTATTTKNSYMVVSLKDGKLGTPSTLKEVSYTTGGTVPYETLADGGFSATGENLVLVFSKDDANNLATETVYPFTVTVKEVKAGTTAVLNTQVADTNSYGFENILAHSEGRWIAVYTNRTRADVNTAYTYNLVAKASNDTTGFKVLNSYTVADKTSHTWSVDTYLAGVVVWFRDGSSAGGTIVDTYTYSYQTYGGGLTSLGTKTAYLVTSGKYASSTQSAKRLGDNKAVNLLVSQIKVDTTVSPTVTTNEAVYFGQIFQKSFGATLQSLLAVCSLMLAAIFLF